MKNIELYKRTVDILYQAYFNGTLEHENCYACAVGNIIAANMGIKHVLYEGDVFSLRKYGWEGHPFLYGFHAETEETEKIVKNLWLLAIHGRVPISHAVKQQIEATGYSAGELVAIEKAFEIVSGYSPDEKMFKGLEAVLQVLQEIHEINDEQALYQKDRFHSHYKSLV